MRLLALLLVPAFIGLVTSQQGQGVNYPDRGTARGGSSGGRKLDPYPAAYPGHMAGNVNHVNSGNVPQRTSSRQVVPDYAPVGQLPMSGNVNHIASGGAPLNTGGSSKVTDAPAPPIQKNMVNQVNMVNAGAAPIGGNNPNSGEYAYGDYGPAAGAANNAPAAAGGTGGSSTSGGNNQVQYNAPGGSSGGGYGGPAVAVGPYSDHAGAGAPLGGAAISDLTQQEAGKAENLFGKAAVGSTVAGVVVAVLVLVGIVGVAAVFLVRQRQSRMTIASV